MSNYVTNVVRMKGIANLPLFSPKVPHPLKIAAGSVEEESIIFYLTEGCKIPLDCLDDRKKQIIRQTVCNHFVHKEEWAQKVFNIAKKRADEKRNAGTEMLELGKSYVQNFEKYGTTTWYDWCIQNWGTTSIAHSFVVRDENTIQFDTVGSRPEPIIRKLAKFYPDLTIDHWWADEDMGCDTGHVCYEDGCEYGGPVTDGSAEAYEIYVFCCGECNCLIQTNGVWSRKNCETCHDCGDY